MNIVFLGDIVGHGGISSVSSFLPLFKKKNDIDFVIANGENAASDGKGLTENDFLKIIEAGVDVVTLGNHYASKQQALTFGKKYKNLLFPLNVIGHGRVNGTNCFKVKDTYIQVTNILGQAFLKEVVTSPFETLSSLISNPDIPLIHIVDYHAESSSEKATMAFEFDGGLTALLGTHTHVQTNDALILEKGTAFMTDVGYCGGYPSIIGFEPNSIIEKNLYKINTPFKTKENGDSIINGVLMKIDEESGFCKEIIPLCLINGKEKEHGKINL